MVVREDEHVTPRYVQASAEPLAFQPAAADHAWKDGGSAAGRGRQGLQMHLAPGHPHEILRAAHDWKASENDRR